MDFESDCYHRNPGLELGHVGIVDRLIGLPAHGLFFGLFCWFQKHSSSSDPSDPHTMTITALEVVGFVERQNESKFIGSIVHN